jgi:formylglycine-generating enzyme required for sulfatase activity
VGLKKPNAWGLHDMAGNVFEWVQDWYGDYDPAEIDHPKGPSAGTAKVIRGASWYSEAPSLGLSARFNNRPGFRNYKVGFRCARDVERAASAAWPDPATLLARKAPDAAARPEAPASAK